MRSPEVQRARSEYVNEWREWSYAAGDGVADLILHWVLLDDNREATLEAVSTVLSLADDSRRAICNWLRGQVLADINLIAELGGAGLPAWAAKGRLRALEKEGLCSIVYDNHSKHGALAIVHSVRLYTELTDGEGQEIVREMTEVVRGE